MFRHFFKFVLLISNHTVFLVQFEINLHLWVFQKAEIALSSKTITSILLLSVTLFKPGCHHYNPRYDIPH